MSLRERIIELTTTEQVDELLNTHPQCAFFKAGGCHKTMQGFGYFEEVFDQVSIPVGFVRVIENREISNYIAAQTEIKHESPQVILVRGKKAVYDVDNWNISVDALAEAVETLFPHLIEEDFDEQESRISFDSCREYHHFLERYLDDQLSDDEFSRLWLTYFQQDSSLRSKEEFSLLNTLFGDVDVAIHEGVQVAATSLKERARVLFEKLEALKG